MLNKLKHLVNDRVFSQLSAWLLHPQHLILAGPKGTGKRNMAELLARYILCQGDHSLTCECPSCRNFPFNADYSVVSPDKGSIKKEQIAALLMATQEKAQSIAGRKVFIIDEAEKLTPQSSNSLLKVLEDRAGISSFIFVCNGEEMLPTIESRCLGINIPAGFPDGYECPISDRNLFSICCHGRVEYSEHFFESGFFDRLSGLKSILEKGSGVEILRFFGALKEKDKNSFFENSTEEERDAVLWLMQSFFLECQLSQMNVKHGLYDVSEMCRRKSPENIRKCLRVIKRSLELHYFPGFTKNDWFKMLVIITS